ncbi:MAG TPA: ABC transporter permease, partial [Anaerolineales bacterium]|nr:ABC transporter permease [Anaerolineales bacterium]
MLKGYLKYFLNKLGWFAITFLFAFILNFLLPRLMPGDPVAAIVSRMAQGMSNTSGVQAIYEQYTELFGTNKPMIEQFLIYVKNVARGDFGFSFSQYPRTVSDVIGASIWWTLALQFPAIIVGWIIGNTLGALAAYLKGGFDKILMPISIFVSNF